MVNKQTESRLTAFCFRRAAKNGELFKTELLSLYVKTFVTTSTSELASSLRCTVLGGVSSVDTNQKITTNSSKSMRFFLMVLSLAVSSLT